MVLEREPRQKAEETRLREGSKRIDGGLRYKNKDAP